MDTARIAEVVKRQLGTALREHDFDVVVEDAAVAVSGDQWTLHLEPVAASFLAIDDEPDHEAAYREAITKDLGPKALRALAAADRELAGSIVSALTATGDPLSLVFVAMLGEDAPAAAPAAPPRP